MACCILGLSLLSGVLLSVEASRNAIFNAFIEWTDKYTKIQFGDSPSAVEGERLYLPAYLPEGFNEKERIFMNNAILLIFDNKAGQEVVIQQSAAGKGSSIVDSENTNFDEVSVSGNKAYLFKAQTPNRLNTLIWEYGGIVFKISSGIDSKQLIQIGESLEKN